MVDLTRDQHGRVLHARLLDVVPGRSGTAYAGWLKAQRRRRSPPGSKQAALDPFRGYANAIRDELPDAVAVLDAFHVVKLGTQVVDEVRRRVQQDTLGRRGHKDDPLYRIRGLLRRGREHLTDQQIARLDTCLRRRRPGLGGQPGLARATSSSARSTRPRDPAEGRQRSPSRSSPRSPPARSPRSPASAGPCGSGERTSWPASTPTAISNGGTEAVNLLIEKTRRLAHGFRNFEHYRLRILLAAGGQPPLPTKH